MQKTVLITGATSGIGKSCAYLFAKNNYNLIITGRRNDRLLALQNELLDTYQIQIQALCFDVRNAKEVNENLSQMDSNKFPIIDIIAPGTP